MPADEIFSGSARAPSARGRGGMMTSALALATFAVAFAYGAVFFWLLMNDDPLGGEPIVIVALNPEPAPPPETLLDEAPADEPLGEAIIHVDPLGGSQADTPEQLAPSPLDEAPGPAVPSRVPDAVADALPPVPDPDLIAQGKYGPLPVIAKDGRTPAKVYARPPAKSAAAAGTRVAIIVGQLGISERATRHALQKLPPEVTLSFAPYGRNLQKWIAEARAKGHEVLLELPMEPFDYPNNDPGPYTLLTTKTPAENLDQLEWLLSRFTGYAGVTNYQGARFTMSDEALRPVMEALQSRGLLYVDNGASPRSLARRLANELDMPVALGNRIIDPSRASDSIENALAQLEETANQEGAALGVGSGFPITVDRIADWASELKQRGVTLVPATSLARKGR